MDRIDKFIDKLEGIFANVRELKCDDSVCGLCEYDGAYMGQSGNWCNECPGFDRDDCFKLSAEIRKKWKAQLSHEDTTSSTTPPTTDMISRQAAIDAVLKESNMDGTYGYMDTKSIVNLLNDLPFAQPEQRWIPCSETVDIPDHEVLCCDRYGEELIGWLSYNDDQWLCESDGEMMYDPIAWREKPEPYRAERRTDD